MNRRLFKLDKKTHSHLLTSGFRRCCEWVQSPALIGCDGTTQHLCGRANVPVTLQCNIEVQAAGLLRLFFFIHLRATLEHQLVGAEFERNAEVKDLEIRHHCDTVSDLCVTTSLDSCLMGTEHVSLLRLFHNRL